MTRIKLMVLALVSMPVACAEVKPLLQTADDIARSMCAQYHQDVMGVSLDDAARLYCHTREAYAPWIDPVLAGVQAGAAASKRAGASAECPEPEVAPAMAPQVAPEATPVAAPPPASSGGE